MGSIQNSRIGNRNAIIKTGEIVEEASRNNTIIDKQNVDIEGSAMESVVSADSRKDSGIQQSLKYSGENKPANSKDIETMQQ
jgi:hypothetical protein